MRTARPAFGGPRQPPWECKPYAKPARLHMSNSLHVLGIAHTVPHEDYLVCAFTAKVLLFPEVIQPFGWDVIEYSNEGSASRAREHVVILTKDRLQALSRRKSREEPLDADVNNPELQSEFQRLLLEKLRSRAKPGDIVCHVWGPNMEVSSLLPQCQHVELCVGYTSSPGLPFRIYETSAWMHWHYGKAGQEDGNNYKWVIPSPIDVDLWDFCEEPEDYAVFLGRVTQRKGINTLVEIARRMPELPIHVYGPGDPSEWAKHALPNLQFKGPVFGKSRADVVRRARCMLMPTVFIEPFGNSGVEAQLCGVPLIGVSFGAFRDTIVDGVTGYRCHTLADWVEAIRLSRSLDRRQISDLARSKYSKAAVGKQYDWAFRQLADLSGRGWYGDKSRKFAGAAVESPPDKQRKPRIWLYMPFFGMLPNYFQLYLDSLGKNADCLSVFLMTDADLSSYKLPDNLIPVKLTLDDLRKKAARFMNDAFGMDVKPGALLKQPYKLCDFRPIYPELFLDVSEKYGVRDDDFVGWGDCDVIYGRISDFLNTEEDYQVIGGFNGHLTAFRSTASFRTLFKAVEGLPQLLLDEKSHIVDETAFRKPLIEVLERNGSRVFYTNRYFCDIIPECFWGLFRQDHSQRKTNFFDSCHPDKEIDYLHYDRDGRLTVVYEDRDSRRSIYCHLQKRPMAMDSGSYENGYYIREHAFRLDLTGETSGAGINALPDAHSATDDPAKGDVQLLPSDAQESTSAGASAETNGAAALPDRKASRVKKPRGQKICLAMIVKNEARVITRALNSLRPFIDHWVIVDTGSTDGTQEIIRKAMHDIPGELHERPWVDFAHNRSEALAIARPKADYSFVFDADDVLELPDGYELPRLNADSYELEVRQQELRYWSTRLVRNTLPWRYEGVLHEFPSYEGPDKRRVLSEERSHKQLPGACIRMTDEGARRQVVASERYRRDAELLERALANETDPFLTARYKFYYAQSCLHAGEKEKALAAYLDRASLGYWYQEVFFSLYKAAQIKAELDCDEEDVIATFLKAHKVCEDRAEALHGAARFCRAKQRYQQGYDLAKRAMKIKRPDHGLALEDWIYDFGVLDEYAVTAFWTGRYAECVMACDRLLSEGKLPTEERARILKNKQFAMDKLRVTAPGLPAAGNAGHPPMKEGAVEDRPDRPTPSVRTDQQNVALSPVERPERREAETKIDGNAQLLTPLNESQTKDEIKQSEVARDDCNDYSRRELPDEKDALAVQAENFREDKPANAHLTDIAISNILMGGENGCWAESFSRMTGDILRPSTPVSRSPHVELLRDYLEVGDQIFHPGRFATTQYWQNALQCIQIQGAYFEASTIQGVIERARRFVRMFNGERIARSSRSETLEGQPVTVRPIKFSDCYELADGSHRLAIAIIKGEKRYPCTILHSETVLTPIQQIIMKSSWTVGSRLLYQPIDLPELRGWPVVRGCTDRLDMMKSFLARHGVSSGSYLDIGCGYGWFVHQMSTLGYDAKGVDRDAATVAAGRTVYGLAPSAVTVDDIEGFLSRENQSYTVVSCLSVLHHYVMGKGSISADEFIRRVDALTGKVLFLDTGEAHEGWFKDALKEWTAEYIADWLRRHTTFASIEILGTDQDGKGVYQGQYGRHLFACYRNGSPAPRLQVAAGQDRRTVESHDAEHFLHLLRDARQREDLFRDKDEVIAAYMEAIATDPTRAEALHGAARFCRKTGLHERGYEFAAQGLAIAYPKDTPGAESWIYEYGLLDELAVNAYWTGKYRECVDACDRLLREGKLPAEKRERVLKNRQFAIEKLRVTPTGLEAASDAAHQRMKEDAGANSAARSAPSMQAIKDKMGGASSPVLGPRLRQKSRKHKRTG